MREDYDVAVIGGGINGCGIARDAAGRGLSVLLVEQSDLAGATSSASSKLIHGGLRYLEHYAFRLVHESLTERNVLMNIAPHLITPLRLVLPHLYSMRPAWLIHCGLWLYDLLAGRRAQNSFPRSRKISLRGTSEGLPLQGMDAAVGFEYYDCWTDDARLVIANARDAARLGADVLTHTRCVQAAVKNRRWRLQLQNSSEVAIEVQAKCLINATGPWAAKFLQHVEEDKSSQKPRPGLRLVQGSHIVVPALYEGTHAYLLQNHDGRVIFAIPYEKNYTLIGTTDRDIQGDPKDARVSSEEVEYLQDIIHQYFGVVPHDVSYQFCGVRPLVDGLGGDAQKANRDYVLSLESVNHAPLLNVYGGKLTTYRKLAENAINRLVADGIFAKVKPAWSATRPLPGGDLPDGGVAVIAKRLTQTDARITPVHAERLAGAYGSMAAEIIPANHDDAAQWRCFGENLFAWEVDYLRQNEWAQEADDILWRRSKLGMHFSPQQRQELVGYMQRQAEHA